MNQNVTYVLCYIAWLEYFDFGIKEYLNIKYSDVVESGWLLFYQLDGFLEGLW